MDNDEQFIREQFGDPAEVIRELREYRQAVRSLDNQHPYLVDHYPDQWVAVLDGEVRAHGCTFDEVMQKIDQEGLPRKRTLVRFIEKDHRVMIL